MVRRAMTLIVAAVLLVGLTVAALAVPVPYVVASPGLALNTLGELDGEEVIQVEGRPVYEHDGALSMVTVQYAGGPDSRMNLFTALSAWVSPSQAVLPEEAIFPPDTSAEEVSQTQAAQMDRSQDAAVAAALGELGIDYETAAVIHTVSEDHPAHGLLSPGDVVVEVDGEPVADKDEVVAAVKDRTPGDPVRFLVERDGEKQEVEVATVGSENGDPVVGVTVETDMTFPFEVEISVGRVGGPSAGMMFALGIMDRLDPEGLTGGHRIAGTGTIDPEGNVGGVSGVPQKMVSAEREGAEYFLVAEESCDQTFESAVTGRIEVVRVATLHEAVEALEAIREGDTDALPRC
ncbi:YlbL family protein [Thermobifida cellulosilytica]|uniref:PDZ/DHR/GLGF domain-containing protein n=1 Tax=Thermobifida cellulosilytica TB100 TaxID=665004 RepID=A0A147KH26_THECS|nr:PDZ domain-containing protein [Thermobifida cellulosilytica]KUP96571.1 PDZ/DHR/GLGF domain-containing protein [Thermobifida cellulosilytica TB100]